MTSQNYNLIDYYKVIKRWRKNILLNMFLITLFATLLSLIIPKTYRASAVLMPPLTESGMSVLQTITAMMTLYLTYQAAVN